MKNLFAIITVLLIFSSCGPKASKEEATALKENVNRMSKINDETAQNFINESTKIRSELNSNPACEIDFESMFSLLNIVIENSKKIEAEIDTIPEIDEAIGYRNSFAALNKAEMEVYEEFMNWYSVLEKTRDEEKIKEINNKVFGKLKIMQEHQDIFRKVEKEFDQKYNL